MVSDGRRWLLRALGGATLGLALPGRAADGAAAPCTPLLDHALRPLGGGEAKPLCETFSGRVLLIVNTASECGFTGQLADLERLHRRYAARGLRVLGFPSDDFHQELEDEKEIAEFCLVNYGVSFPMFQKVAVSGADAHPLFRELAARTDGYPRWNFNKYLVDRSGRTLGRYDATEAPLGATLVGDIEAAL